MFKKAIKMLNLKIGLLSNRKELLPQLPLKAEYESLLTDFHKIEEMEFSGGLDSFLIIVDEENVSPLIRISPDRILASGSFLKLSSEADDLRFSFFGNEGLIFRYVLMLLEEKYGIYSYHACSMYDERSRRLFIACGSAGSGKTCLILRGLELGLKVFSTELTQFEFKDGKLYFYKGSLVDNIRIGNLKYTYPDIFRQLDIELPETADEWGKKIAVDLGKFETPFDEVSDPEIVVLFPHIEEERSKIHLSDISDKKRAVLKLLFDNATEKIGGEVLLYESIPVAGLDSPEGRKKRLGAIGNFIEKGRLVKILKVVAGSRNCWEGII